VMMLLLLVSTLTASPAPTCSKSTAVSLTVSWPPIDGSDLYYVAIASDAKSRPFALQTTAATSMVLLDLIPSTSYWLSVRSHTDSENIVWGWRDASPAVLCTTQPLLTDRPHRLKRVGDTPRARSIAFSWIHALTGAATASNHSVGIRLLLALGDAASSNGEFGWEPAAPDAASHVLHGLHPGQAYEVIVRDEHSGTTSEPLRMRTASASALHAMAYRISEYTFDVDFLENHDAASKEAMPLYYQNGGAINETEIETTGGGNWTFDECLAELSSLCGVHRGTSFECMACADANRPAVTSKCGTFSDGDDHEGWAVHFYCGIGWPGSSFQRSPITEYCVEHLEAPQTDPTPGGDGFAQYVSCNSDECDGVLLPEGNLPRLPTCICWVWDDRMISQEPTSRMQAACSTDVTIPWVGSKQCNCSFGANGTDAAKLPEEAPMANYVGRSKVFLPYYRYKDPMEEYPISILAGDNLSFPRKRGCKEDQTLGDGGCTWKRTPFSRMLYGQDLLAKGWNATPVRAVGTVKDELDISYHNIGVFDAALDAISAFVTPRCCGC